MDKHKVKCMDKYKVECAVSTSIKYLSYPFEVCFSEKKAMNDFMELIPDSYSTKYYEKDDKDEWTLVRTAIGATRSGAK